MGKDLAAPKVVPSYRASWTTPSGPKNNLSSSYGGFCTKLEKYLIDINININRLSELLDRCIRVSVTI